MMRWFVFLVVAMAVFASLQMLGVPKNFDLLLTLILAAVFAWIEEVLLDNDEDDGGPAADGARPLIQVAALGLILMVSGLAVDALGANAPGAIAAVLGMVLLFVVGPVVAWFVD